MTARDVVVATHYPVFDRALLFTRLSPAPGNWSWPGRWVTGRIPRACTSRRRRTPARCARRPTARTGSGCWWSPGSTSRPAPAIRRPASTVSPPGRRCTSRGCGWTTPGPPRTTSPPTRSRWSVPLHPGARHAYVVAGFGGWGLSGGLMAGLLLTALITGRGAWRELYDPRRLKSVVREAPSLLKTQAEVARHFVGDRLKPPASVADLAPGDGALVRSGGSRLAVHRDDEGCPARRVGPLHPPRLSGLLQPRRARLGVPLPRLAVRGRRLGDPGSGGRTPGAAGAGGVTGEAAAARVTAPSDRESYRHIIRHSALRS